MIDVNYAQHDGKAYAPNEFFVLDRFRKGIETEARIITGAGGITI